MKNDKTLIPFKSLDSKKDTMKNKDFTDLKETKAPKIKPQPISLDSLEPLKEVIVGKRKNITNSLYIFNNKKTNTKKSIMS